MDSVAFAVYATPPLTSRTCAWRDLNSHGSDFKSDASTCLGYTRAWKSRESAYRRRDSNPHCLVSKTNASFHLGYAGVSVILKSSCLMPLARLAPRVGWFRKPVPHPTRPEGTLGIKLRRQDTRPAIYCFRDSRHEQFGYSVRKPVWTRHDLNVRPQAPQTCALIPLSYGSKNWRRR